MASVEEKWLTFDDGLKVYTQTWKPDVTIKAKLVFVHGFSHHSGTQYEFFPTLASRGIEVHASDQRGWGRTCSDLAPSHKGLVGPSSQVYGDLTTFLKSLLPSPVPLFLMGHSMGGGIVLCYPPNGPPEVISQIRGFLLEAPLISPHPTKETGKLVATILAVFAKLLPNKQVKAALPPELMSRDEAVQKDWADDKLCHDTATFQGLVDMENRGRDLRSGKVDGTGMKSVWVGHGTGDGLTSYEASKKWVENCKVPDKELKTYNGYYHKLHGEPTEDRFIFYNDVADWILARSGDEASPSADKSTKDKSWSESHV